MKVKAKRVPDEYHSARLLDCKTWLFRDASVQGITRDRTSKENIEQPLSDNTAVASCVFHGIQTWSTIGVVKVLMTPVYAVWRFVMSNKVQ